MKSKICGIYYVVGCEWMAGLRYYYSQADSDGLRWILAPVAGWVRVLSGHAFAWLPGAGYVNHSLRFLIAPSCSGVQFLIIAGGMLLFSFLHDMGTGKKRVLWTVSSPVLAYVYTVFVNGVRISLSIDLPPLLMETGLLPGCLTAERLHTVIGVFVYFGSLLFLYRLTEYLIRPGSRRNVLAPVFWYFLVVLLLPAVNLLVLHRQDSRTFLGYAVLVGGTCLLILILFTLPSIGVRSLIGRPDTSPSGSAVPARPIEGHRHLVSASGTRRTNLVPLCPFTKRERGLEGIAEPDGRPECSGYLEYQE